MTPVSNPTNRQLRVHTLDHLGVEPAFRDELLCRNELEYCFDPTRPLTFPWPDEPFVEAWEGYAQAVRESGSLRTLSDYLPQLRFPIRDGISQDAAYLAVTRNGASADELAPPEHAEWRSPENGVVFLRPTPAGRIACIFAAERSDFVYLVRALSKRNEPVAIPDSMGACVVTPYNNWNRLHRHRDTFLSSNGTDTWPAEFTRLRMFEKSAYQDSFVVLSGGPYSGVPASELGKTEEDWLRSSLQLRQAHEAAHYFTRRVLGSARNHINDEVLCDFYAMTRVLPSFDGIMFLRFFGLENYPHYRPSGRLQNYRGTPPLTDGAFEGLQRVLFLVAENLETIDRQMRHDLRLERNEAPMLLALCQFTIEEMAASGFPARFHTLFHQTRKACLQASENFRLKGEVQYDEKSS